MTPAERDQLLARLDERTEKIDRTLDDVGEDVKSLLQRVTATETDVAGLKSRERWGMARSIALAACTALGLRLTVGA